MQLESPDLTYICSTMSSANQIIWDQKVKGQSQNVCVGFQTERNIVAAAYVSHAGFSLSYFFASVCRWSMDFPGFFHSWIHAVDVGHSRAVFDFPLQVYAKRWMQSSGRYARCSNVADAFPY